MSQLQPLPATFFDDYQKTSSPQYNNNSFGGGNSGGGQQKQSQWQTQKKKKTRNAQTQPMNHITEEGERNFSSRVRIIVEGQLRFGPVNFNKTYDIASKYRKEYYADNTVFEGPDSKDLAPPVFFF